MHLKKRILHIVGLITLLALASCSTKKNTAATRFYHSFTTRYNVYFNGIENYKEQLKEMEVGYEDNFTDLLYMHPKNSDFVRMQGAFITPQEIKSVVEFVIANNESVYDSSVKDAIFKDPAETAEHKIEKGSAHKAPGVPPEVFAAARIGLDGTPLTISSLQRKLNLGFPKAARVVDIMKDLGIVEYNTDDKKYHVVISEEELDALENGDKTDPEDGGEES